MEKSLENVFLMILMKFSNKDSGYN